MNNQIWKTLAIQSVLSGIYVSAMGIWGEKVMLSAFVGCMACLIPNSYAYIRMAKQSDNNNSGQWLVYAYRIEIGEWRLANDRYHFLDVMYCEGPRGSSSFVVRICVNSVVQYVRTICH